jgi:hypothetical protein
MVVCPLYQLPSRASQIYQQAAARNVCIFSYSHLSVLGQLVELAGQCAVINLLHQIFRAVEALNPSKDAGAYASLETAIYWTTFRRSISLRAAAKVRSGSEIRAQRPSEPGLECADKPTLRPGGRLIERKPM